MRTLMALRCLMISLLLGSALVVNVNDATSLTHPAYQGLLGLIVLTYAATVAFGFWLRARRALAELVLASFALDALLATAVVLLTGLLDSPFTYLFLIVSMLGGVVAGRSVGLWTAMLAGVGILVTAAFELDVLHAPGIVTVESVQSSVVFRSVILVLASAATGVLGGVLRERLDRTALELVESERDMAELRSHHERILTSLRSGVITTDADGNVVYANPAALGLLGAARDDIVGASLDELGLAPPTDTTPEVVADLRWEVERDGDGDDDATVLGLSMTSLTLEAGEGRGDLLTFQDLTRLRAAEAQLQQAERLAGIGRLAASVAHEIRNPLASISGSVEMLSSTLELSGDDAALMRIISKEIDRLNGLIRELLEYAGPRDVELHRVDVRELVRDVARLFSHDEAARDVDHTLDMEDAAVVATADADILRQVLLNLWRNAVEAMKEHDGDQRLRTAVSSADGVVRILVEDSGPGVPDTLHETIFEPFFTTREGGTGLGLATAYQVVSNMGGRLQLLMEHDETCSLGGAAFEIRLPAADRASRPELETSEIERSPTDGTDASVPVGMRGLGGS